MRKLLLLALLFTACTKEDDLINPTVNVSDFNNSLFSGETISFEFSCEDNEALSNLELRIVDNFNPFNQSEIYTFDTTFNFLLNGQSSELNWHFPFPKDFLTGSYNLVATVQDVASNSTNDVVGEFFVQNSVDQIYPELNITVPGSDEITVLKARPLLVAGTVTDESKVNFVDIRLVQPSPYLLKHQKRLFNTDQDESFEIAYDFLSPDESGIYNLHIIASDGVNNTTLKTIVVIVQL